jgi:hypothetical protein
MPRIRLMDVLGREVTFCIGCDERQPSFCDGAVVLCRVGIISVYIQKGLFTRCNDVASCLLDIRMGDIGHVHVIVLVLPSLFAYDAIIRRRRYRSLRFVILKTWSSRVHFSHGTSFSILYLRPQDSHSLVPDLLDSSLSPAALTCPCTPNKVRMQQSRAGCCLSA